MTIRRLARTVGLAVAMLAALAATAAGIWLTGMMPS